VRRGSTEEGGRQLNMRSLLKAAVRNDASDLLISAGMPPLLRIHGELFEVSGGALSGRDTQRLLFGILNPYQRAAFEQDKEIDFALSIETDSGEGTPEVQRRFRVNGFYQKGQISCALRVIPDRIPPPEELGLPRVLVSLAEKEHGLILVTGPTGHGKTTTLASLVDHINGRQACHIITIEDPIEYVHRSKQALVEQREVHADTKSFHTALKYILRQSPDVILIGEMRDQETIAAALTAAETGHLVLATLHTNDAVQTVDRVIDVFPAHQQNQIRAQLASCLLGVFAQRLLSRRDGKGRLAVFEIMIANTPIRALIRDRKTHQIPAAMETNAKDGMATFERSLRELYENGTISREVVTSILGDAALTPGGPGGTARR
jgi:twitching motility protein PilT